MSWVWSGAGARSGAAQPLEGARHRSVMTGEALETLFPALWRVFALLNGFVDCGGVKKARLKRRFCVLEAFGRENFIRSALENRQILTSGFFVHLDYLLVFGSR